MDRGSFKECISEEETKLRNGHCKARPYLETDTHVIHFLKNIPTLYPNQDLTLKSPVVTICTTCSNIL
jgi:hypothetical protein